MFLNKCHPNYRFPNERDMHHSKTPLEQRCDNEAICGKNK